MPGFILVGSMYKPNQTPAMTYTRKFLQQIRLFNNGMLRNLIWGGDWCALREVQPMLEL